MKLAGGFYGAELSGAAKFWDVDFRRRGVAQPLGVMAAEDPSGDSSGNLLRRTWI